MSFRLSLQDTWILIIARVQVCRDTVDMIYMRFVKHVGRDDSPLTVKFVSWYRKINIPNFLLLVNINIHIVYGLNIFYSIKARDMEYKYKRSGRNKNQNCSKINSFSFHVSFVQNFLFHFTSYVIVHNIQYFFRNSTQNCTIDDKYSGCTGVKWYKTDGGEPTCHVCNQKYELS